MDYIWVAVAFSCGFLVKQLDLPPLIGYLAAGFGLHAIGVEPDNSLSTLADLGIEPARLQRFNTGGSSGEPLIFLLGNERVSHDVAAKRRATRWWGVAGGVGQVSG